MRFSINIPEKLRILFWDFNLEEIDLFEHKVFVIERVLEKGNPDAVKWLFGIYSRDDIEETVNASYNLSAKTCNFWKMIFDDYEFSS